MTTNYSVLGIGWDEYEILELSVGVWWSFVWDQKEIFMTWYKSKRSFTIDSDRSTITRLETNQKMMSNPCHIRMLSAKGGLSFDRNECIRDAWKPESHHTKSWDKAGFSCFFYFSAFSASQASGIDFLPLSTPYSCRLDIRSFWHLRRPNDSYNSPRAPAGLKRTGS